MLKKILLGLVGVLAVLGVVIAMQPSSFEVTRTATINAPASEVHALINDFHKWEGWSPWEKMDPAMKKTFEGSPVGQGAIYKWVGNSEVGEGQMTILESQAPNLVKIKLDFLKPMTASNLTEFKVQEAGAASSVSWSMNGQADFLTKAFCLFLGGMDKMVGPDFEKGLTQLKALAEKRS